ncbi:MAG: response regulator transcription factor [Anaerovoracaceae bacterium]
MNHVILVVEDDKDIVSLLKLFLENEGYTVLSCNNGIEGREVMDKEKVDLAIVDLNMPLMNGYEFIKSIRTYSNIPVIILSAQNQDSDKILGLEIGADDYMTKPFNPLEIIARVKSNLRRVYDFTEQKSVDTSIIQIGSLKLDSRKFEVTKNGEKIILTPMEFKILKVLMGRPSQIYTKARLYEAVVGDIGETDERAIVVHISNLRDKIGNEFIDTVRGLGYRFEKE